MSASTTASATAATTYKHHDVSSKVENDTRGLSIAALEKLEREASASHTTAVQEHGLNSEAAVKSLFYWGEVGAVLDAKQEQTHTVSSPSFAPACIRDFVVADLSDSRALRHTQSRRTEPLTQWTP